MTPIRTVLITGAGGYVGRSVLRELAQHRKEFARILAVDVRKVTAAGQVEGIEYVAGDVRDDQTRSLIHDCKPDSVVHLASIVTPGKDSNRAFEFSVDVLGTQNVLNACVESGVRQIVVTSSGAAYGYHADNPQPLRETDRLRGNPEFAYSDHKRQVEEMLARYRIEHPRLKQLIFRPGTILGEGTNNQITRLWDGRWILGFRGVPTPYVFIWDRDVVACIVKGILEEREGIYNLAGDGTMTTAEIAQAMGKKYVALPVGMVKAALWFAKRLGLSQYGPEQTVFLQYRPVLSNERLKSEFGYTPRKTTRETFECYMRSRPINSA